MKMQEVRKIARKWNIDVRVGRSKKDIIHDIQKMEGYTACFGTKKACDQYDCLWREDCIKQ